ncbi:MAG TPA: acyltransferase [Puia sp.]
MTQLNGLAKQAGNNKLFGLDHLRTLAITLVFFFHYQLFQHPEWVRQAGSFGWTGVDLFFVLSGYLIAGQLFSRIAQGKCLAMGEFYFKRAFRILPAYLVILTLYFCLPAFREREALPPLWKFLTFTQNFGLDLRQQGTFSHAWSLCIEEQFYLLLPLIMLTFLFFRAGKKAVYLLLFLFILGIVVRIGSWFGQVLPFQDTDVFWVEWYKWIYYPFQTRLDGLLVGVSLAGLFQFYPGVRDRITRQGNLLLLIGLGLIAVAYFFCSDPMSLHASVFGFPLVAIAYGTLVAAAVSPSCILYKFNGKISAHIAALSYAIYLSHKGVIHLSQQLFMKWGIAGESNLMFFLCIVMTLLGALVLRYTIEKPFLKARDYILQKRRAGREQLPVRMRA